MPDPTLQRQFDELMWLKSTIENPIFQRHIAEPVYEELNSLKAAYSCESLKELHHLKGKREGIEVFTKLLKNLPVELKNAKYELERSAEEA